MCLQTPYYNHGRKNIAFVFSVPGSYEVECNRPVAGATGRNLAIALKHLNSAKPQTFCSLDRYDYRITNAHTRPLSHSYGETRTEARHSEIIDQENVKRVLENLQGCKIIVLCGRKAQLLSSYIKQRNYQVVEVSHLGSQALNRVHNTLEARSASKPYERNRIRVGEWANDLLLKLHEDG